MANAKFNPRKYIIENGRKLPIEKCLISDGYADKGLTLCLLVRKQPGGKYTFASLMLDRYCLGVKDCFCNCNMEDHELENLISRMANNGEIVEVDPVYFHNMIYAAVDYGMENGCKPHKDFALAERVLDPEYINDGIDDIEVGENGMPLFIDGPNDDVAKILATLNRHVGEGNYKVILHG